MPTDGQVTLSGSSEPAVQLPSNTSSMIWPLLQRTATMQIDVDRVVAIKLKQRDKKLMQARAIAREIDPKRL